jgi:oxygen-dependent protoporphyrinogen oxidase
MSRSCVIVGAGPAGLSAAYRLANAGLRVTVLEGESVIGGRTRSERVGDVVVDTGAAFITTFHHETLALLRELHLEALEPNHQLSMVATPFGKLPLDLGSPRRILRFPLISWSDKLRTLVLFAPAAFRRRSHLADLGSLARMDRGDTIEGWSRSTLGPTAYDYLMRSGVEPYFCFGAEEASAALGKALLRHALRWHILVVPKGTGSFCDALAARLQIRTGCVASGLEVRPGSVLVRHSGGSIEADYVILSAPATAISRLDGTVPEADRTDLSAVRYLPSVVLCFGYERPITVQYPWVVPAGPGRHPIARVHTISGWVPERVPAGKDLVYVHAAGWRSAELLDLAPDKITAALRADAEEVFGRMPDPDWIRLYARREGFVVPAPRHYRRMHALVRRPRSRLFYAGDWLTGSTIEGAVRTGLVAAQRVLAAGS